MDIYIMPQKKYIVSEKRLVLLKDISEVYSADFNVEEIKNIAVFKIPDVKRGIYSISVIDIVNQILNKFPKATVVNEGEAEVLIEYSAVRKKENKLFTFSKIAFISLVLFAGGATAIMSFHSDGEMPQVMKGYYKIFTGEDIEKPYILEIPYSLGLAAGIIVFFNHFCGKQMTYDPTPIEVQITSYEEQVIKDQLQSVKKGGEEK